MTVGELIKELQKYHENCPVIDFFEDEITSVTSKDWKVANYKNLVVEAVKLR